MRKKIAKGVGDNAEEGRSYGGLLSACEILVDLQVFKFFVISVNHSPPGLKVAKKLETILHLLAQQVIPQPRVTSSHCHILQLQIAN